MHPFRTGRRFDGIIIALVALAGSGLSLWWWHWMGMAEAAVPSTGSSLLPVTSLVMGLITTGFATGLTATIVYRSRVIRREVEERTRELSESRRLLGSLMASLPGMVFRGNYEDSLVLTFISDGALNLTGFPASDFLAGRVHLRDLIHPDDLARVRDSTRAAMRAGREVELEYRIRTRGGGEKWLLSRGRGIDVGAGAPVFEGLAIDITAQKEAESGRLALERRMLEGQKMESLGLLAGGIAHDFNNLLSTIIGNVELTRLTLPAGQPAEAKLRQVQTAAVQAGELCRQLLAYAGKGRLIIEPVNLSALVEELVPLLRVSIARNGALRLNLAGTVPAVLADATQIRQIVMNLVINAADAIAERGGEIVLTTGSAPMAPGGQSHCLNWENLPPGEYVFLEVRDNGVGMTPEVLAKIFDPFFTTKPAGRGLGLAAVLGIVRGHGGALCVDSTPGVGSVFRLLLPPASTGVAALRPAETNQPSTWRHQGRVLVVDDEGPVRTMMSDMLRSFGLEPVEAAGGREALEAFQREAGEFELVVLDVVMPAVSGRQTLEELRALKPRVRILLFSGFGESDLMERFAAGGPLRFLAKPFTRATLEHALRELLALG